MELKDVLWNRRSVRKFTEVPLNVIFNGHPAEAPEGRDQYEAGRVHYVR